MRVLLLLAVCASNLLAQPTPARKDLTLFFTDAVLPQVIDGVGKKKG